MTNARRRIVFVGLTAVFVAGATSVFLVGSHNRATDRAAVLRYEASVLAQVREMSVVAGSMADAADAFGAGHLTAAAFAKSAGEWQQTFTRVAGRIAAVRVPRPFGQGETMFAPAAREYARAAGLYAAFAACSQNSVGPSASCIQTANASSVAAHALSLYRHAAEVMQDTRERLGLGKSPNFGDPPR
ncbi:MAG: hypothetical protein ABR548_04335 [Actinomycetota bacterium]|nr:hypothetical protein [Actinomycetota bacterium]